MTKHIESPRILSRLQTDRPIPAEVSALYVRRLADDGPASLDRVEGAIAIKQFLGPPLEG